MWIICAQIDFSELNVFCFVLGFFFLTCIRFPLSNVRNNSSSLSSVRLFMCSLEFDSFTACSSLAFCSFSLRSDCGDKVRILKFNVLYTLEKKYSTTYLHTSLQHLFAVSEHHVIDGVALLPWFDAQSLVPSVLSGTPLLFPFKHLQA